MHCNLNLLRCESSGLLHSEHEFYHNYRYSDNSGYVFICWKNPNGEFQQKAVRLSEMAIAKDALVDANLDVWISQAVFSAPFRRKADLKFIGLSFIDLDCHKFEWAKGLTQEELSKSFIRFCEQANVPRPSLIVFSGRGLQVKWLYDRPIPRKALPRWDAVQKELVRKFAQYGADQNAKDAARILRFEGTLNTKSGKYVHVVHKELDGTGEIVRYGFDNFADIVLPFTREQIRQKKAERQHKQATIRTKRSSGFTIQTLHKTRVEDFRTLAKLRGGIKEGHREVFLFDLLCSLVLSGECTDKTLFANAQTLAEECCVNFSVNKTSLTTLITRVQLHLNGETVEFNGREVTPVYTFKTETLIERHDITPNEQKHLKTLISSSVKHQRAQKARIEKRRANGVLTRKDYENRSKARQERARALFAEGMSKAEIARLMGLSRSTITRYLHDEKSVESVVLSLVVKPADKANDSKNQVARRVDLNASSCKSVARAGRSPEFLLLFAQDSSRKSVFALSLRRKRRPIRPKNE